MLGSGMSECPGDIGCLTRDEAFLARWDRQGKTHLNIGGCAVVDSSVFADHVPCESEDDVVHFGISTRSSSAGPDGEISPTDLTGLGFQLELEDDFADMGSYEAFNKIRVQFDEPVHEISSIVEGRFSIKNARWLCGDDEEVMVTDLDVEWSFDEDSRQKLPACVD